MRKMYKAQRMDLWARYKSRSGLAPSSEKYALRWGDPIAKGSLLTWAYPGAAGISAPVAKKDKAK